MRKRLKVLRTGQAKCRLHTCQFDITVLLKIIARNLEKTSNSSQREDAKTPSPSHKEDKEGKMQKKKDLTPSHDKELENEEARIRTHKEDNGRTDQAYLEWKGWMERDKKRMEV